MNFRIRNCILLIFIFFGCISKLFSQCTDADFIVNSSYCLDEVVRIENVAVSAASYEWDFCANSFIEGIPNSNEVNYTKAGSAYDFDIISSGNDYHIFIPDRNREELLRLDFNDSLLLNPETINLGDFNNSLMDPTSISIVQNGIDYTGLLVSYSSNQIQLLDFGESLTGTPAISDLTSFVTLNGPAKVELFEDNGDFYAFVLELNNDQIKLLSFGSTIDPTFSISNIPVSNSNLITDFDLIRTCDDIVIVVSSRNNNTVNMLNFSNGLTNPPIQSVVTSTIPRPVGIDIVELEGFHILVSSFDGSSDVFRITLDDTFEIIEQQNLGNINGVTRDLTMEVVYDRGEWRLLHINSNGTLYRYKFPDVCNLTSNFSSAQQPSDFTYSSAGDVKILLRSITNSGLVSTSIESVSVLNQNAPDVGFVTDNACVSSINTFTPNLTGLTSYSWDFDGDNVEDSDEESPIYQFPAIGTYNVRLDVSDGTCTNSIEQEITIYPEPPTPTFTVTSGSTFCTNNELSFVNITDATGYDGLLTYQWIIDGDEVNQPDTVYTFSTSGSKTITLQASLPGCSSIVTEQQIDVGVGPIVSFSYANNCFASPIEFISTVLGDGIESYSWDFGDGLGVSTEANPLYTYSTAGTYEVTLTIINDQTCETTYLEEIEVNDQELVDFITGEAIENLPVSFSGLDLTLSGDTIIEWQWDLDGLGISDKQDTSFVFESGIYEVSLSILTGQGCNAIVQKQITVAESIYPSPSFKIDEELCLDENLNIINETVNGNSYEWDFCYGDLRANPSITDLPVFSEIVNPQRLVLVEESNNWYAFATSRNSNNLVRLDFGESLESLNPISTNFPISGLGQADGLVLAKDGDQWIGFIASSSNNRIIRLTFGTDLESIPAAEILDDFGFISSPRGLSYAQSDGIHYLIVSNISNNNYTILNLGSSLSTVTENIVVFNSDVILGADLLADLEVLKEAGQWYGYGVSFGSNVLHKFRFGNSLMQNPIEVSNYIINDFNGSLDIAVIDEGSTYYCMVSSTSGGELVRLNLGELDGNDDPVVIPIPSSPNIQSIGIVENGSIHTALGLDENSKLIRFDFGQDCGLLEPLSELFEPSGIRFESSGSYEVGLTATHRNGSRKTFTEFVTINTNIAPSISFNIDPSRCITNSNTFTSNLTGLTSYSWDFDGDNVEDSDVVSPTYQFLAAGTYTVRLDVSDGTCANFTEQEITIYPEPPTPTFDVVSANLCEQTMFTFSNTIDETGYDDVLTYEWYLNGEVISTLRDTTYVFNIPGNKVIGLKSMLPGCESSIVIQSFDIIPSPVAIFSSDTVCLGETSMFTNSSSNANSYQWDFGDGGMSTLTEPTHVYLDTGNFVVQLIALDISGACSDTFTQTIRVNRVPPVPAFEINSTPYCIGTELAFSNLTQDQSFNGEVLYEWIVTDIGTFDSKDTTYAFSTIGEKTIELKSIYRSCESSSVIQVITINDLPTSSFTSNVVCQNEITIFINTSENADSYHWDFGDGFESTGETPSHLYAVAGSYMATLTSTDSNGCTNEVTNEVIVLDIPLVNFDFELACSSDAGVQFTDMTVVENADIVGWTWLVDDIEQSTQQNPILTFESPGIKTIRLVTQSSNGCSAAYEEQVDIRNTPQPDFTFNIGCQGEASAFTDITSSVGNPITQWLWTIEGETYDTEEVSHVFNANGLFDVTLEVTAENFCTEIMTKTIEVLQLPSVDFSVEGICSNEVISLLDNSTDFEDVIVSRNWMLNGEPVGNGTQVLVEPLDAGTYSVELQVETQAGCMLSSSQELVVNPTPISSFTSSKTYGLPGDAITFTNTSTGGSTYQWLRNEVSFSSSSDNASVTFSEVGEHEISLVSTNSFGCTDTTSTTILIAVPVVDLVIVNFEIIEQNGIGQLFLDIQNLSNLPVEVIDVFINLEDKLGTSEQVLELIEIGSTERIALDVGIPLTFSKPSFLCVNLRSQYQGFEDVNPLNNEKCLTLEPEIQVEAPFPNPVRDEFRMKVVLPEGTQASVSLLNSAGKIEQFQTYDLDEGLNNIFMDMSTLSTGIYLVTIKLNGNITTHRIVKF